MLTIFYVGMIMAGTAFQKMTGSDDVQEVARADPVVGLSLIYPGAASHPYRSPGGPGRRPARCSGGGPFGARPPTHRFSAPADCAPAGESRAFLGVALLLAAINRSGTDARVLLHRGTCCWRPSSVPPRSAWR